MPSTELFAKHGIICQVRTSYTKARIFIFQARNSSFKGWIYMLNTEIQFQSTDLFDEHGILKSLSTDLFVKHGILIQSTALFANNGILISKHGLICRTWNSYFEARTYFQSTEYVMSNHRFICQARNSFNLRARICFPCTEFLSRSTDLFGK